MRIPSSSMPAGAVAAFLGAAICGSFACRRPTTETNPAADAVVGAHDPGGRDAVGPGHGDARGGLGAGRGGTGDAGAPGSDAPGATAAEPIPLPARPLPPRDDPSDSLAAPRRLADPDLAGRRPRFHPDGTWIVFAAGEEGKRDVYVVHTDGSGLAKLTDDPGDDRDPSWLRRGEGIVWSTNRGGSYDLWTMKPDGSAPTRLTDREGDELEPAVAPVAYRLLGVVVDGCVPEEATTAELATYDRIAFTSVVRGKGAIVLQPLGAGDEVRLSPPGSSCRSPSWAGDGGALSWVCEGRGGPTVFHAEAQWDRSAEEALASARRTRGPARSCAPEDLERWTEGCAAELPRRAASYDGRTVSRPADKLDDPSYSANGTLLLAAGGEPAGLRMRSRGGGEWTVLPGAPDGAARPVWSPDGARVAFETAVEGGSSIEIADADFYLQDVRDLADYPELWDAGRSSLLPRNDFVARAGGEKEFFGLYERVRRARRAPFLTVDVALQAFADEFSGILREAERQAQGALLRLTRALYERYLGRLTRGDDPIDRAWAVFFAVPWVLLEAADAMETRGSFAGEGEVDRPPSAEELLARVAPERAASLPEWVRAEVEAHVAAILAHEGEATVRPPGAEAPVAIDCTRFRLHGHYARSPLAGWYLAVQWLGLVPLPVDRSTFDLIDALDSPEYASRAPADLDDTPTSRPAPPPDSLGDLWDRVDMLLGAVLGRPLDPTVSHLRQLARKHPEWISPFRADLVAAGLRELLGPPPVRDQRDEPGAEVRLLRFAFLSRRQRLDDAFFARLAAPSVPGRAVPDALDVLAILGSGHARQMADAAAEGREWADRYREVLDDLETEVAGRPASGYGPGDIDRSWLALLAALADPAVATADSLPFFARTEAWQDRRLFAAHAGYAQFRHDALLLSARDEGAECGSGPTAVLLFEQLDRSPPRGFVDPAPRTFRALARLADRVYVELAGGGPPAGTGWAIPGAQEDELSARRLAERLAELAEKELRGEPFSASEEEWIRQAGGMMQALLWGGVPLPARVDYDEGRAAQGVSFATEAFAAPAGGGSLELAVGRIAELYVVVPDATGRRLAQGGILTFYELTRTVADGTGGDAAWSARLGAGEVPPLPGWTASFLEPGPAYGAAAP